MSRPEAAGPVNKGPRIRLPWPLSFYQTAVGKKWVMALTGIGLLGFILVHMIGNLHLYEGAFETYEYGEALRDLGGHFVPRTWLLWGMRIGLIAMFGLHIHSAATLTRMNQRANPKTVPGGGKQYEGGRDYIAADYASRSMRWTGIIIGLFLVYHLADLTWGHFNPDFVRGDPYHNVTESLGNIGVAIIYIVANIALALHIYHGAWSMFQTLGINSPKYNNARRRFAQGFALVILVGNLSFPIMVQADVIDEDNGSVVRLIESGQFEGEEAAQ
jgi:succinate dehydrogenase / fumarate reductase cytochrome b subunit